MFNANHNSTPLTINTNNYKSSISIPPSQLSQSSTSFSYKDLPEVPWECLEAGTANVSLRNSDFQKDLDSIDKFSDEDDIDAAKIGYTNNIKLGQMDKNPPQTKSQANGRQRTAADEEIEKEDKTVKCLYYTLQCCECTIS